MSKREVWKRPKWLAYYAPEWLWKVLLILEGWWCELRGGHRFVPVGNPWMLHCEGCCRWMFSDASMEWVAYR